MNRPSPLFALRLCALLVTVLCGTFVTALPCRASLEQEMAAKNKQLEAKKKAIQSLTAQERKLHKDLAGLEDSVKDAAQSLDSLEKELAELRQRQAEGAKRLSDLLSEREKTTGRLAELMRTLWPIYLTSREEGFASPDEWAEANRRGEWLTALYREAQALREDIERQSQIVADQQSALDQNAADTAAKVEKIKASKAELEKRRVRFERQLASVRSEKKQSEKEIQGLMGAIAGLKHKISLQSERKITKLQGSLDWPAKGKTVVSFRPDGNPPSNGIGLALQAGTPVHSMSWGKVVHNDQLRGFGQVVIIFHGDDYYSLYAFLSDAPLPVGREVKKGEQIGVCGFYPAAGGDGLYFELRFKQKVINPLKWLKSG
jgi:septal ring factor EnvC (AmiA/AmiB activator)